jgi:hypothetical protein
MTRYSLRCLMRGLSVIVFLCGVPRPWASGQASCVTWPPSLLAGVNGTSTITSTCINAVDYSFHVPLGVTLTGKEWSIRLRHDALHFGSHVTTVGGYHSGWRALSTTHTITLH